MSPHPFWERVRRIGFWPTKVWELKRQHGITWPQAEARFHWWVWYGPNNKEG